VLTVLLTRHGHTDRSEPDQYLGQHVKALLTDRGRHDAEALAARLRDVPIDRAISSPLSRAAETAAILVAGHRLELELDDRMLEMDYGAWEGMTVEEVATKLPEEFEQYERDPSQYRVGGGENGAQVARRVSSVIDDLLSWAGSMRGDRTCLLVGHSSVNRVLLATVLGVPLADYRRRFQIDWASLTVLRWPQDPAYGPLLLLANDVAHVRGMTGVTWD
jgi:probable phosphoglycerate mutase